MSNWVQKYRIYEVWPLKKNWGLLSGLTLCSQRLNDLHFLCFLWIRNKYFSLPFERVKIKIRQFYSSHLNKESLRRELQVVNHVIMDNKTPIKAVVHPFQSEDVQTRPFWLDTEIHIFLPKCCSLRRIHDSQMVNPGKSSIKWCWDSVRESSSNNFFFFVIIHPFLLCVS